LFANVNEILDSHDDSHQETFWFSTTNKQHDNIKLELTNGVVVDVAVAVESLRRCG